MAENRENDRHNLPEAIPIRDHFRPVIDTHYSGIARGTINANNFELKPALINMVQQNQFAGTATSDPHVHLRTFLEITDTELATKFLSKYFPPAKSAQLKIEISTFRQTNFEQFYGAWERYKELLRRCPNHGFEYWVQIELFYNGLNGLTRTTVDAVAGVKRTAGVYAVDPITSLTAQIYALTTQLAAMNMVSTAEGESAPVVVEDTHLPEEVQYINNKNFEGYGGYRETHMANIGASLKILETQVGQITKQLKFQPSSAVPKTADPSMREVNSFFIQHQKVGMIEVEEKRVDHKPSWEDKPTPSKEDRGKKGKNYDYDQCIDISLLPYPHRFLQLKAEFQKKKGLENLKNLYSNIQSAEQVEVSFTGGDDKGRQGNLPQKLQDPREFIVPCEIGGQLVKKTICDSGASVNIMPSSLYEKLGLTRIKPTELSLQLADKSVKVPLGIVEDIELKIDKLKVLEEFVVLDMENSQDVHVILGRPLLATVRAIIDVKRGNMTMEVEDQLLPIRASKKSYDPP
ncbi:uncharacterized protein LOC142528422 [Primulina tabacum]|uniref:uncharacterized protein LOC142528422 n=1 Tax=Primulina tabacum TaxID=48773 RepID=UPI003F5A8606